MTTEEAEQVAPRPPVSSPLSWLFPLQAVSRPASSHRFPPFHSRVPLRQGLFSVQGPQLVSAQQQPAPSYSPHRSPPLYPLVPAETIPSSSRPPVFRKHDDPFPADTELTLSV